MGFFGYVDQRLGVPNSNSHKPQFLVCKTQESECCPLAFGSEGPEMK